jgi:hypothetical protein
MRHAFRCSRPLVTPPRAHHQPTPRSRTARRSRRGDWDAVDLDVLREDLCGPASDHFDGRRFFDPDGVPPKSLGEVLRWQFGGDGSAPIGRIGYRALMPDTPPQRVDGDKVRLSFVGPRAG